MVMEDFIRRLEQLLAEKPPGAESQYRMAPVLRLDGESGGFSPAAVLVILYLKDDRIHTLLMKRPDYQGAHSNQVSLPGGKKEKTDGSLLETALREAREETGIDDKRVRILGQLSPLEIPVSGMMVQPVVGWYPGAPVFKPNPSEVSYLIETPLADLLHPHCRQERLRTILCKAVRVPFYHIAGNQVWGATAMILSEFLEILRRMEPGLLPR